jgi:signal transduction histidine kinase
MRSHGNLQEVVARRPRELVRFLASIIGWLIATLLPCVCFAAEPLPRSVLIIDELGPYGPFNTAMASGIRTALSRDPGGPVSLYAELLDLARFGSTVPEYEAIMRSTIEQKYGRKPIGVILVLGFAGLQHVLEWRKTLWPEVPVVFGFINEASLAQVSLPRNVTGRTYRMTLRDGVAAAQVMVPNLKRVAVIGEPWSLMSSGGGSSRALPAFDGKIEIIDMTGLAMAEIKRRAATLPSDAAILYTSILVDGAGVRYTPRDALAEILPAMRRPVVVQTETQLGFGAAGGFVALPAAMGTEAGELALRIINGESASTIPLAVSTAIKPVFDWRELKRWNVSADRLPAGSEIRFRELDMWDQYRWYIILVIAVVLLQALLISGLIFEHRARRAAETLARASMFELAHVNRLATAGQLSASIAHEVNQPLAGIVAHAAAGLRWLKGTAPNLDEGRAAFKKIMDAGHHAAEVIEHIRAFFRKDGEQIAPLDINDLIHEVLGLLAAHLKDHRVTVETALTGGLPPVSGDRVQLQQVVMNLVMNAAEAMDTVTDRPRLLRVVSQSYEGLGVLVRVEDSGAGIDPGDVNRVFQPFFTTKPKGMGMGLAICRSIAEAHQGKLWASPGVSSGAVFHLVLPAAEPPEEGSPGKSDEARRTERLTSG